MSENIGWNLENDAPWNADTQKLLGIIILPNFGNSTEGFIMSYISLIIIISKLF